MSRLLLLLFVVAAWFPAHALSPDDEATLREIIGLLTSDQYNEGISQLAAHEEHLRETVTTSEEAGAHLLLGRVYFYAEKDLRAKESLGAALELDPELADAHFFLGLVALYSGDSAVAEQSFRDATAADSSNAAYFVELGKVLAQKNETSAALEEFRRALAVDDDNFGAHFISANLYASSGNYEEAETHYLAALDADSSNTSCNYNLGQLYQNTKRHRLALKYFSKVVSLDGTDWRALEKVVQENQALELYEARDAGVENIYRLWRDGEARELSEQGFFIREQLEIDAGRLIALEYFEIEGEWARKYVFKLHDEDSSLHLFDVSLGSYERMTQLARETGDIGPGERLYHLDGYGPNGSHFTYGFFVTPPDYDATREMALGVFSGARQAISSTTPPQPAEPPQ